MKSFLLRTTIAGLFLLFGLRAGSPLLAGPARGTALAELAASLQPGQWSELATEGFGNGSVLVPGAGCILEYCDEASWNPVAREVTVLGTARPYGPENSGWAKYRELTNSWTAMPPLPFYPGAHSYDLCAIDPATGDFYFAPPGEKAWRYAAGEWAAFPGVPTTIPSIAAAWP